MSVVGGAVGEVCHCHDRFGLSSHESEEEKNMCAKYPFQINLTYASFSIFYKCPFFIFRTFSKAMLHLLLRKCKLPCVSEDK